MEMFNPFDVMKSIAAKSIQNQERNPEDFFGEDGLLVCGKCGEKKQTIMEFPDPTKEEPDRKSPLTVTRNCKCARDREEREAKEKQDAEDLERIGKLRKASLMDEKFKEATFEHFEKNKFNARNLKLCERYVDAFDKMVENNQGLIFWGGVGTGKSYAAACVANKLLSHKVPVMMTSFVKLLELIQGGIEQETAILSRLNRAKLVIFDDLGAERNTDYALEKVYNIVDSRYRRQLPMILTTNLTIEEMKSETDIRYSRIYDRLFETCYPMQFTGTSWRKKTASKRFQEMEKLLDDEQP